MPPSDPPPPGWSPQQPPPYPGQGAPPPPAGAGSAGWGEPSWTGGTGAPGAPGAPPWSPPPLPPKPGIIPLRPLGVGEILDGAISSIRSQPKIMLGLSAVVAVASQLVTVPLTWLLLKDTGDTALSVSQPATPGEQIAFTASALSATLTQVVVTLIAALLLTGILTVVVSRAVLGERISTGAAWAKARPRIPALLAVTGLVLLIELGVLAVALAPGLVLAAVSAPTVAVVVVLVIGLPIGLAAAIYLYVAFALAPAAIVLERRRVRQSLRRSRELVTGAWWRTFGILALVNIIAQFLAGILAIPFTVVSLLVTFLVGDGGVINPYAILPLLVTSVGTIVASALTWPFTAAATALLYVDRRMRREALDLELARAAGVPPPS